MERRETGGSSRTLAWLFNPGPLGFKAPLGEAKPAEGKVPAPQHCLGLGVREGLHGGAHPAPWGKQGLPAGFCIFI